MWVFKSSTKTLYACAWLVTKYQKRISGPILDRIEIHIEVPSVDYGKLSGDRIGESSESIRTRVQAARNIQLWHFSKIVCNADMHIGEMRKICKLQDEGQSLMRASHNILKLARTIAHLTGCE